MNKIASVGLAAVLVTSAFAAPAFASFREFDPDFIGAQLVERGVNVADHNGIADVHLTGKDTIRAVVKLSDGSTQFQYFDLDTLRPLNGGAVASELVTD
jgi:hypothetical protein